MTTSSIIYRGLMRKLSYTFRYDVTCNAVILLMLLLISNQVFFVVFHYSFLDKTLSFMSGPADIQYTSVFVSISLYI